MTSLDTYVGLIGQVIIDYYNKQRSVHNQDDIDISVLSLDPPEEIWTDIERLPQNEQGERLRVLKTEMIKKQDVFLTQCCTEASDKTYSVNGSKRKAHLFYFLEQFNRFRLDLLDGPELTESGWSRFTKELQLFVHNCELLINNEMLYIKIDRLKDDIKDKKDDAGRSRLKGLGCLRGFSASSTLGDLGGIVADTLLKNMGNIKLDISNFVSLHRSQFHYSEQAELRKSLFTAQQNISEMKAELNTLHEELKESKVLHITEAEALKALQAKQDTLAHFGRGASVLFKASAKKSGDVPVDDKRINMTP